MLYWRASDEARRCFRNTPDARHYGKKVRARCGLLAAETYPMQIIDLRQLSSWQLEPLLAEEAQQWREELHWDYRAHRLN